MSILSIALMISLDLQDRYQAGRWPAARRGDKTIPCQAYAETTDLSSGEMRRHPLLEPLTARKGLLAYQFSPAERAAICSAYLGLLARLDDGGWDVREAARHFAGHNRLEYLVIPTAALDKIVKTGGPPLVLVDRQTLFRKLLAAYARVTREHLPKYSTALEFKAGERVSPHQHDEHWTGFTWCETAGGQGCWIPEIYLERQGEQAALRCAYSSAELKVKEGEILTYEKEAGEWAWCTNSHGESGWAPLENLEKGGPGQ